MLHPNFCEAKRWYLAETCESIHKYTKYRGLTIVSHVKDPENEVSYKQIFQDFYVSYREDLGDKRDVWTVLAEARKLIEKYPEDEFERKVDTTLHTRNTRDSEESVQVWEESFGFPPTWDDNLEPLFIIRHKKKKGPKKHGK